ncbi:unnamed protein product, partial [Amoebophrya sp. A25]|eukprot:GSA25T00004114001.1
MSQPGTTAGVGGRVHPDSEPQALSASEKMLLSASANSRARRLDNAVDETLLGHVDYWTRLRRSLLHIRSLYANSAELKSLYRRLLSLVNLRTDRGTSKSTWTKDDETDWNRRYEELTQQLYHERRKYMTGLANLDRHVRKRIEPMLRSVVLLVKESDEVRRHHLEASSKLVSQAHQQLRSTSSSASAWRTQLVRLYTAGLTRVGAVSPAMEEYATSFQHQLAEGGLLDQSEVQDVGSSEYIPVFTHYRRVGVVPASLLSRSRRGSAGAGSAGAASHASPPDDQ